MFAAVPQVSRQVLKQNEAGYHERKASQGDTFSAGCSSFAICLSNMQVTMGMIASTS